MNDVETSGVAYRVNDGDIKRVSFNESKQARSDQK